MRKDNDCVCEFKGIPECECTSNSAKSDQEHSVEYSFGSPNSSSETSQSEWDLDTFDSSSEESLESGAEEDTESDPSAEEVNMQIVISAINKHLSSLQKQNKKIRELVRDIIIQKKKQISQMQDSEKKKAIKLQLTRLILLNRQSEQSLRKQRIAIKQNISPLKLSLWSRIKEVVVRSFLFIPISCYRRKKKNL